MRADRLLRMLMLLQRHRHLRAADLAIELEVSERTVLRDFEALAAAGVPVWTERGPRGGLHLMDGWNAHASGLTPDEAQALFGWSARESARQLGLGGPLASALAMVAAGAPESAFDSAEKLGEVVLADRRRWFAGDDDVPVLPVLRAASAAGRRIRLTYQSASAAEPTARLVDPAGLVDHSGRWYLVAEHDGIMRMFRVSRVVDAEEIDEPASPTDRRPLPVIWADLRQRFESGQRDVEVTVVVSDGIADRFRRLVRMPMVPDTDIEVVERRDVAEVWRLRVTQPDVIVAMAVMFADDVEVIEPDWMPGEVLDAARRVVDRYAT